MWRVCFKDKIIYQIFVTTVWNVFGIYVRGEGGWFDESWWKTDLVTLWHFVLAQLPSPKANLPLEHRLTPHTNQTPSSLPFPDTKPQTLTLAKILIWSDWSYRLRIGESCINVEDDEDELEGVASFDTASDEDDDDGTLDNVDKVVLLLWSRLDLTSANMCEMG